MSRKKPTVDLEALIRGEAPDEPGHDDFVPARLIKPSSPVWYWRNRLVQNDLNILAGTQGLGKSQVAIAIAAEATRQGHVALVVSAEDSPETTIIPRLLAAGAEFVDPATGADLVYVHRQTGSWELEDSAKLQEWIAATEASFVVIDPIAAYVSGKTDTYKDAHVRNVLAPLRAIAADQETTVLAVMHLKKGAEAEAVNNVGGSIAWTAAPRSVLMVKRMEDDKTARVLYHAKCNVGIEQPALMFTIESVEYGELGSWTSSYVSWGDEAPDLDIEAQFRSDAEGARKGGGGGSEKSAQAETFLRTYLADGDWHQTADLNEAASAQGISGTALSRAKSGLVEARNFPGGWKSRLVQGGSE